MRGSALGLFVLGVVCCPCLIGCNTVPLEGWGAERVKGSPDRKVTAYFAPGTELYTAELEGGSLRATVERVVNNVRSRKIEVLLMLHNTTAQELQFDLSKTVLEIDGVGIAAKDLPPYWDANPDLQANSTRKKKWAFELVTPAEPGVYNLRISDLRFSGGGSAGEDLSIEVKVPGRAAGPPEG